MITGPILIIDDDLDDWEIFKMIFTELGVENNLLFFDKAKKALDYLYETKDKPFLILCDVNMPLMTGIEFRKKLNEDEYLRRKSILSYLYLPVQHKEW